MSELARPATSARETPDEAPLLSVKELKTYFPVRGGLFGRSAEVVKAVDGVTFDVPRGEVFGLVGESGSGKTTLGRSILKLVTPTSGRVLYRGRDLVLLSEREMRPLRRELSLVFQDPNASLNPAMTIGEGVGHPLRIHGLAKTREEARRQVCEMLERVGLHPPESFLERYPEDVSGGQKQRLVIARALITKPKLVVADEPVAALDMSVRARVLELMLELKRELDLTYVFITHDLATARFMCDRIGILYLGGFVEWGDAPTLFDDAKHPYTRALLDAIPLPEAGRRHREKKLPRGEIPDALRPPAGCRFHPRCPEAFEQCGWEGRDLVDALEERWTRVDADTFERELALFGGLDKAEVGRDRVRFARDDPAKLAAWLKEHGPELPSRVFLAVTDVVADRGGVSISFRSAPEPVPRWVAGRHTACHLYDLRSNPDTDSEDSGQASKPAAP